MDKATKNIRAISSELGLTPQSRADLLKLSDSDDDDEDYSDWSIKDLKKECRTRGIKVTKGMAKADMVKALEADDKE